MIAGIRQSISAGLPLLVALVLMGCGPSFSWEGTWSGNHKIPPVEGQDPSMVYTIGQVDLTIKGNRQFELVEAGIPMGGEVQYRDGKAILQVKSQFGKPLEVQGDFEMVVEPQEDGSVLFTDPTGLVRSLVGGQFDLLPSKPLRLERQGKKESQP